MSWVCKDCGTNNDDALTECMVCGCLKEYSLLPDEDEADADDGVWVCKDCGTVNEGCKTICDVCGSSKELSKRVELNPASTGYLLVKKDAATLEIVDGAVNIPDGYKTIGGGAFSGNNAIEKVFLPNSIERINNEAFLNCKNLKEVNFSGTLKYIGNKAFSGCSALTTAPNAESLGTDVFKGTPIASARATEPTPSPRGVSPSPAPAIAAHTPTRHRYTPALKGWQIALIVIGSALLITCITLLGVFGSQIYWWQWQHIIGSIVGAVIVAGILGVSLGVDSSEAYKGCIIGAVVVAVLNVILGFALKNNYNIIFYWIGAYTLIGLVAATILAANDFEDEWAFFGFIAIVVNAVFFIIITILSVTLNVGHAAPLDPDVSRAGQWAAGVVLSIGFCIGMYFVTSIISDKKYVGGIFTSILTAVLTIINIAFAVAFGNEYQVVFGWFSASHIVAAGIGLYMAFMDDENRYAYPGNIAVICLNIAMLVIINMYDG